MSNWVGIASILSVVNLVISAIAPEDIRQQFMFLAIWWILVAIFAAITS